MVLFAAAIFFAIGSPVFAEPASGDAARAFQRGSFAEAASQWQQEVETNRLKGDTAAQIDAMVNLAGAYQALGQQRGAVQILEQATSLAEKSGDRSRLILAESRLGAALAMTLQPERAEALLRKSLEMARSDKSNRLSAAILNDLGNLLAAQQKRDEALTALEESVALARQANDPLLAAEALCNAAATSARFGLEQKAEGLNDEALKEIDRLESSHEKASLLLTTAQTDRQIKPGNTESANRLRLRAAQSCQRAIEVSDAINDNRIRTYALGYLGQLYEEDKQLDQALAVTRRAAFVAQQAEMPEALYRWQWQIGRLLAAQGETAQAIASYRRAVQTLQIVRHDVSLCYGNATGPASFRQTLGPLFFELADLLFQQADQEKNSDQVQGLMREARDTVEQLKTVELEDYFQDDCIDALRAKTKSVEAVDAHTAVVYLIPLATRTEILMSVGNTIHRFTAKVGAERLTAEVREFRRHLETRTTYAYLAEAQQLYDWIIRPIHGLLVENHIDTFVFVPDGALQTIPFASLHDGKRFLIEEFAVAITPGLSLMEPHPIHRENVHLLLTGLSDSVQGFPSLDFVPDEVRSIEPVYRSKTLMNGAFVTPALEQKLTQEQFSIVHIASHGQFNHDARKTFVLTYDGKLTLNDLEALIRPSQYRGQPVELLVLSACQTAAGDDRAALGLAGVAVKAGARSALASLWFVNDQSTSALISEVYQQLSRTPSISKAQALQAAQIKMLGDRRYRHPCYWAPYLIIGNWL
jgi:CHAT domain-containing protein